MFDPTTEPPLTLTEAAKLKWLKGRGGKRIHIATLHRWASAGLHGAKLETMQFGGQRVTSEERLKRFFAALSDPAPRPATRQPVNVQSARADAVLAAAGI